MKPNKILIVAAAILEIVAIALLVAVIGRHVSPFTDERVLLNGPVVLPLILFCAIPFGMAAWALFPSGKRTA